MIFLHSFFNEAFPYLKITLMMRLYILQFLVIQEPLLDWKVVCYQMAIAKLEVDLWIISQIGRSSEIRLSSNPPGLISSDSR